MTYVMAEPCIGTEDAPPASIVPVDCIRPKKNTSYDDGRPTFDHVPQNEENAQETRSVAQSWSATLGLRLGDRNERFQQFHNPSGNSSVATAHLPSLRMFCLFPRVA